MLKAAARDTFVELKGRGDDLLQNSAVEERAKAERTPSPELLASYTAEDEVLFGPLATDVEMDDLIGK